ncbi:MAG: hypothetical protein ASARMPREDX12_009140 [Alectoria sarmentosa]|nr:MAG: hypothetical protein ASARMPREDX12_009140 [Alectoria sarmentosa]
MVSGRTSRFRRKPCGLHVRPGLTQPHLSLSEEARNTERYRPWNSDLKLRHSRVVFVSAGTSHAEDLNPVIQQSENRDEAIERSIQEKSQGIARASENQSTTHAVVPDGPMSNMTLNDLQSAPATQAKPDEEFDPMFKPSSVEQGPRDAEVRNDVFFIDLEGADEPVHTGLATPIMRRSPSPTASNSSEEIITFAGRRRSCHKDGQKYTSDARARTLNGQGTQNVSKLSGNGSVMATVVDDPIIVSPKSFHSSPKQKPPNFSASDSERVAGHLIGNSGTFATKSGLRRRERHPRKKKKGDGFLNDYVTNLRDEGNLETFAESSVLNQRDLDGSDTAEWRDQVESLTTGSVEKVPLTTYEEWDSADLEDFDELSTSNEALDSVEQVLSKRERPSGVQYLVIGAGCTIDDASWFPVSSLSLPGVGALIQDFEDKAELSRLLNDSDASVASLTEDEQVAQNIQEDLDDQEDENDLEDRRKARMTDEQIARLLSKQEELGVGSDDRMLFDGGDVGTDSEEELDGLWERVVTHLAPSRSKRTKRSQSNIPSATAFVDVLDQDLYHGFDVMDREGPSLRKRPKSRRGKFSMQLSDSELEQSIQTAREKDRTKKMKRKQEREELRAQGLLGKKNNKIVLKAKYSEGMSMTEVKNEIRDFLLSSMESLPLPPMAQGERKMVHEIANVFNLKSKSNGSGKSRFPVLYKTSRTIQYNEETLKAAESVLSSGRFLPRMDRVKRKGALAGRGRRGGTASAGVSYRDGDVVGAAAPEIGQENRGRTMLEKMGWSTGTALGALNNNRGLVQPVAQVVKTSKSGLG